MVEEAGVITMCDCSVGWSSTMGAILLSVDIIDQYVLRIIVYLFGEKRVQLEHIEESMIAMIYGTTRARMTWDPTQKKAQLF